MKMNKLLASTALVAMTALPVYAQSADTTAPAADATMGTSDFSYVPADPADTLSASTLIGKRVYTSEAEIDSSAAMTEASTDWDDVGEISDVLMSREGQLEAILVDVGGFLGIGEKTVAVSMDQLNLIQDGDDQGEYFVAFTASKEQLENAPAYEAPGEMSDQAAATTDTTAAATTTAAPADATAPASGDAMASNGTDAAATTAPAAGAAATTDTTAAATAPEAGEGEQMAEVEVDPTTVTAEQLQGAPVYDSNDEKVGDVSELVIAEDGTITNAVVDLGGFLGIGAKPVAFSFDQLRMTAKDQDGTDLSVHVSETEDQMKAMPEYDKEG